MPPRTRKAATRTPKAAADDHQAAPDVAAGVEERRLQLPFVTLTVTRPARNPANAAPGRPGAADGEHGPGAVLHEPGVQRLLFYGGVAALGVIGALEWPVAAAIVVGSYVATRNRDDVARDEP